MINIAIVEDDDTASELLLSFIKKYKESENIDLSIKLFRTATAFLKEYHYNYSLVFMDIQMPEMNGMEAAIKLREMDKVVSIIFITSMVQYAQKGYEVDAVSFMIKPIKYSDFYLKMKKAISLSRMNELRDMTINIPSGICRISTSRLMYVEIVSHRLKYHLVDQVIEMSGTLASVEKNLVDCGFLKCNNCYLLNPIFILEVKGLDVKVGNEILRISRPKRNKFLEGLASWYAGGNK